MLRSPDVEYLVILSWMVKFGKECDLNLNCQNVCHQSHRNWDSSIRLCVSTLAIDLHLGQRVCT